MAKLKLFTGNKRCRDGEIYRFKKGKAIVPGMWHKEIRMSRWGAVPMILNSKIYITVGEFNHFNSKESEDGRL
jgi:hypothetical protein